MVEFVDVATRLAVDQAHSIICESSERSLQKPEVLADSSSIFEDNRMASRSALSFVPVCHQAVGAPTMHDDPFLLEHVVHGDIAPTTLLRDVTWGDLMAIKDWADEICEKINLIKARASDPVPEIIVNTAWQFAMLCPCQF